MADHTTSRAFWTVAAGRGELREAALRVPGADECLVETRASGVSRGTEALVFRGGVPPSQHQAMRAPHMEGNFPFPVKYGYSAVGVAPALGRVFVLHPHQDRFVVPRAHCVRIPDGVPTERATLAANMETALNIVWDAQPVVAERMMVIGGGVVGLCVASLLARIPLAQVTLVDLDPARAVIADRLGCGFALPEDAPGDQELIVHASGSEAGLHMALSHAAVEGRIVEASWFGDRAPSVPLGEAFHARRLRIIASQVGAVAPAMRGRRSPAQRLALALELLRNDAYDLLLGERTRFDAMPAAMPRLLDAGQSGGGLCPVITYGDR